DWEERTIEVMPRRPVKTALVLLEFHQPQGAAWFDDLHLTERGRPTENLLAAPGFEEEDPAPGKRQAVNDAYETRRQALLHPVATARSGASGETSLAALENQRQALAAWIRGQDLARIWPRELRDLDDAAVKLRLCARLMQGAAL